ncbi:unnamed protein product, partial [Rotaria socialis]
MLSSLPNITLLSGFPVEPSTLPQVSESINASRC